MYIYVYCTYDCSQHTHTAVCHTFNESVLHAFPPSSGACSGMVAADSKAYIIGSSDSALAVQEVALDNGTMATMVCFTCTLLIYSLHISTAVNRLKGN